MAGLKENTTYTPASFTNLAKFNPLKKAPATSSGSAAPSNPALKSYRLTSYDEGSPSASALPVAPPTAQAGIPLSGAPSALPTGATAAPSDYGSWKNATEVPIGAKFSNLSAQLGGGQFAPTPTGASDYSVQSVEKGNDITRATYIPGIGGSKSGSMQIDHIVPVFLGGTDTDDNKEVLGIKDHLQKTKTQEVIRALYNDKVIGKNEALTYALNWQNLPGADQVDLTPVVNSSGAQTINLDTAKKIFNQWKNPSADLGFSGTIKAIKDNWGDAVKQVQNAVNTQAVKYVPPATWDFVKGITEGYTGGWIQGGETPETAYGTGTIGNVNKTVGGVAKFAGNMVGSIAAWMTLERVLAKGATILANPAEIGKVVEEGGAIKNFLTGQSTAEKIFTKVATKLDNPVAQKLGGLGKYMFSPAVKAATVAEDAAANAGKVMVQAGKAGEAEIKDIVAKTVAERAVAATATTAAEASTIQQGTAAATKMVKDGLAKMVASRDLGKLITRNVVVSQVFGQLSKPIAGESRTTRLMSDTVNGLIFGVTPPGLKNAYIPAVLGAASTYIASGDSSAALQTGLMFGGMHAMGSIGGKTAEDSIVNDAMKIAHDNAAEHIKSITGRDLPVMPAGPKATPKAIEAYKVMVDNEVNYAISQGEATGKITETNNVNEIKRLKVVGQVLKGEVDMQSVGWRAFGKNAEKDWAAFNPKQTGAATGITVNDSLNASPEAVAFINKNFKIEEGHLVANDIMPPAAGTSEAKALKLKSDDPKTKARNLTWQFTWGKEVNGKTVPDPVIQNNMAEFEKLVAEGKMKRQVILTKDSNQKAYIEAVNKNKKTNYDPNELWSGFYIHPDTNEVMYIGKVPTQDTIGEVVFDKSGSKTVKGKAGSQNENNVKYNRPSILDHTANNKTLTAEAERLGVQTMVVNIEPPFVNPSGETNVGMVSGQHYLLGSTSDTTWRNAEFQNRGLSKADMTADAIRSWQAQVGKGEKPIEMKTDDEANAEFDMLIKSRHLNISPELADQFTVDAKRQLIRDYHIKEDPILNKLIIDNNPEKSVVAEKTIPPKTPPPAAPTASNELPFESTPKAPEVKIAAEDKTPPDFLNPEINPAPKAPEAVVKPEDIPEFARTPEEAQAVEVAQKKKTSPDVLWRKVDQTDKTLYGIKNDIDPVIERANASGDTALAEKAYKLKKEFSDKSIIVKAEKIYAANDKDLNKSFDQFLNEYSQKINDLTGTPPAPLTGEERSAFRQQFKRMALSRERDLIAVNSDNVKIKKEPLAVGQHAGSADIAVANYEKANGLKKGTLSFGILDKKNTNLNGIDSIKLTSLQNSLADRGYQITGIKDKGIEDVSVLKTSPELIAKFNEADHLLPGEKLSDLGTGAELDQNKALRVYLKDVLHLPIKSEEVALPDGQKIKIKGLTGDTQVKRTSMEMQDFVQDTSPKKILNMETVDSPTIKDRGNLDSTRFKAYDQKTGKWASEADKKAYESQLGTAAFDGAAYLTPTEFERIAADAGYANPKDIGTLQARVIGTSEEGLPVAHKVNIIKATPTWQQHLLEITGVKMGDGAGEQQFLSFTDNAKYGAQQGKLKISSDNFFIKDAHLHDEARVGMSILGKVTGSDAAAPDITAGIMKRADAMKQFVEDIRTSNENPSTAKDTLLKIFDKYKNQFGTDPESFAAWGELKKSVELGAGKNFLSHQIESKLLPTFLNNVITHVPEGSAQAYPIPEIPLHYDGADAPARYAKRGESVLPISKEEAAAMNKNGGIIAGRNPATDLTNLTVNKVYSAAEVGFPDMGKNQIIISTHDGLLNKQMDFDGDKLFYFQIGEKGLPTTMAETITKNTSNDFLLPTLDKTDPLPLTQKGIAQAILNASPGSKFIGKISSTLRALPIAQEFDGIKITRNGDGAIFDYMAKGKKVYSINKNKVNFDFPEDSFTVSFRNGVPEQQFLRDLQQKALDSMGRKNLIQDVTKTFPNGASYLDMNYHTKNVIDITKADGTKVRGDSKYLKGAGQYAKAANDALGPIQSMFNESNAQKTSSNSIPQYFERLKPFIELSKGMKDSGVKISPVQEALIQLNDTFPQHFYTEKEISRLQPTQQKYPNKNIIGKPATYLPGEADKDAVKSLITKYGDVFKESPDKLNTRGIEKVMSPAAKEITTLIAKQKIKYQELYSESRKQSTTDIRKQAIKTEQKDLEKEVMSKFNELKNTGKLNQQDLGLLSYWAASRPEANLHQQTAYTDGQHRTDSWFSHRFMGIINANPEVAKNYYAGFENISPAEMIDHALAGTEIVGK